MEPLYLVGFHGLGGGGGGISQKRQLVLRLKTWG